MRIKSVDLLKDLIERTKRHINTAEDFKNLSNQTLNYKPDIERWSVLECLEHLNRYGDFYIPEFRRRIASSNYKSRPKFKSGWLGNYFANSMLPKEKLNKMKTFSSMNPNGSDLDRDVIDRFINQQHNLLGSLADAHNIDLARTKTSISISKWIKLKLGDTFRVVIYHNYRHILQAENIIAQIQGSNESY